MQARPTIEDIQRQEHIRTVSAARAGVAAVDLADFSAIFIMLSKEMFRITYEVAAKYIMMPLSAAANIIQAILAWRQAYLNRFEGHSVVNAVIETIGAAAITIAVVGALAFTALFTIAAPAMFAATFLMKATYNLVNAVYFGVKAAKEQDPVKEAEYSNKSKESVIGAFIGVFGAVAVLGVMIFGKAALAVVGIAIGAIGAAIMLGKCIHAAMKNPRHEAMAAVEAEQQERAKTDLSQGAKLMKGLGVDANSATVSERASLLEHDELAEQVVEHQHHEQDIAPVVVTPPPVEDRQFSLK